MILGEHFQTFIRDVVHVKFVVSRHGKTVPAGFPHRRHRGAQRLRQSRILSELRPAAVYDEITLNRPP